MNPLRNYSASDVRALMNWLYSSGNLAAAELAGMERLVELLQRYETMTNTEIEADVLRLHSEI